MVPSSRTCQPVDLRCWGPAVLHKQAHSAIAVDDLLRRDCGKQTAAR